MLVKRGSVDQDTLVEFVCPVGQWFVGTTTGRIEALIAENLVLLKNYKKDLNVQSHGF
jgi:hypothetical protein